MQVQFKTNQYWSIEFKRLPREVRPNSRRTSGSAREDHVREKFYEAYEAWKIQTTNNEQLIADQLPFSIMEEDETILRLKDLHDEARTIFEKIRLVRPQ